ncbi:MAG: hypothetical protein ACM3XR_01730 [Bacillota bacterium]
MSNVFISVLYIIIAITVFIIPVLLRRVLSVLQGIMAAIWLIYAAITNLERINFVVALLLPVWVFGSLFAVNLRNKEENEEQKKFHEKVYHSEK